MPAFLGSSTSALGVRARGPPPDVDGSWSEPPTQSSRSCNRPRPREFGRECPYQRSMWMGQNRQLNRRGRGSAWSMALPGTTCRRRCRWGLGQSEASHLREPASDCAIPSARRAGGSSLGGELLGRRWIRRHRTFASLRVTVRFRQPEGQGRSDAIRRGRRIRGAGWRRSSRGPLWWSMQRGRSRGRANSSSAWQPVSSREGRSGVPLIGHSTRSGR